MHTSQSSAKTTSFPPRKILLRFVSQSLGLLILLANLVGCLERTETIRVNSNGSVDIQHRFVTESPDEFQDADAVPEIASGWEIKRQRQVTDSGKTRFELTARKSFQPGVPLPTVLARRGDPAYALFLQSPTTLKMEDRTDGRYYHFQRTYQPRAYAQIRGKADLIDERIQKITAQAQADENGELPELAERQIVELAVQSAVAKLEAFARLAFLSTYPAAPPDAWLAAPAALREFERNVDYSKLIASVQNFKNAQDDTRLKELIHQFDSAVIEVIQDALRKVPSLRNQSAFWREFENQRKAFAITEDLGDDNFTIELEMPGQIVASNAPETHGNRLVWRFNGQLLRDRKIEILATSRIPKN